MWFEIRIRILITYVLSQLVNSKFPLALVGGCNVFKIRMCSFFLSRPVTTIDVQQTSSAIKAARQVTDLVTDLSLICHKAQGQVVEGPACAGFNEFSIFAPTLAEGHTGAGERVPIVRPSALSPQPSAGCCQAEMSRALVYRSQPGAAHYASNKPA